MCSSVQFTVQFWDYQADSFSSTRGSRNDVLGSSTAAAEVTLALRAIEDLVRKKVRDLPLEFRLDDSMAMVPEIRLSALSAVVVGARISKRGDATPHTGDLQGLSSPVAVGARGVQIQITEELP